MDIDTDTPPVMAAKGFSKDRAHRPGAQPARACRVAAPVIVSPFLTPREAAAYCRYTYETFRKLDAPALGSGRGVRKLYTVAALERWLANRGRR